MRRSQARVRGGGLVRVLFLFSLFLIPATLWCQEATVIGWDDLIGTFEFEDPFAVLSRGQLMDLGVVADYRSQLANGEVLSQGEKAEKEAAFSRLEGIDVDDLLARRSEIADLRRRKASASNAELEGTLIRMPGYALPLEFDGQQVVEFLMVPWVGACIHTPPPPPNQILYVTVKTPFEVKSRFVPVWIEGILEIGAQSKNLYLVDGSADIAIGYSISNAKVEEYEPE